VIEHLESVLVDQDHDALAGMPPSAGSTTTEGKAPAPSCRRGSHNGYGRVM
jgi:hypothetical protein